VLAGDPEAIPRSFTMRSRPKPVAVVRESTNCLSFTFVALFMPVDSLRTRPSFRSRPRLAADEERLDRDGSGGHEVVERLHR
jgi:hypothetical protein